MIITLLGIGLGAGVLSGLLGIGGAVLVIPCLVLLLKFEPRQATVTSLVALLLPVGFAALYRYYKAGALHSYEIKAGLWIALGIFVGAYGGAYLNTLLPQAILQKSFAIFLILIAIRMWFSASA